MRLTQGRRPSSAAAADGAGRRLEVNMGRPSAGSAGIRDLAGVLVAAGAILIYGLSCRPAWDPSGKRVAFPYRDGERSGIALYEMGENSARRLVEEQGEGLAGAQCAWSSNGRWLYVVHTLAKETLRVQRLDPVEGTAERVVDVGGLDDAHTVYPPALIDDRWLWISAVERKREPQNGVFRVDLARRRVEHFFGDDDQGIYVMDGGPRGAFYVRGPDDGPMEFGRLDAGKPRLLSLFTVPERDSDKMPALEVGGKRIAWFEMAAQGRRMRLTDEDGKDLDVLPLPGDVEATMFAVWTAHGVVAAAERRLQGVPNEVGLLHVDVATRSSGFVALGSEVEKDGRPQTFLQPAASPDGARIAVAVSGVKLRDDSGAALLIFDAGNLAAEPLRVTLPPRADRR